MSEYQTKEGLNVPGFASWNEFRSYWANGRASNTIFRGQRHPDWKLQSLWEREIEPISEYIEPGKRIEGLFADDSYQRNRDRRLTHFKDRARRFLKKESDLQSDDDWWAFGRHHGLVSPLLDWTRNPLVAAFFALVDFAQWVTEGDPTSEKRDEREREVPHVTVWALDLSKRPFQKGEFEFVDRQPGFEKRQEAQAGVFTRLSDGIHFDVQSYLSCRGRLDALYRCHIPIGVEASKALRELHQEKVHHAILFPDFWGAAMYANTRHLVRTETTFEMIDGSSTKPD
ncbi:MAG: FRG domain-containing protein [Planctomycetes bacterium]|nr:FRG domain-containing protein [Planctomycetota bacterium]